MSNNLTNFVEKWDALISKVETLMRSQQDEILTDNQIYEQAIIAGKLDTYENRTISNLFTYITGETLYQYINMRRQTYIFERFLDKEKWSSNIERDISCVGETQYIANFKKVFDLTPKQVFNRRNDPKVRDLVKPALYFSQLSADQKISAETYIREESEEMIFGLKKSDYNKIQMVESVAKHYGLNDYEKNFAYTLATENSLSYEDCFQYVYDYVWSYTDKTNDSAERDKHLYADLGNKEIIFLYFNYDYSLDDICLLFNDRLFNANRKGWYDNNTIPYDFSYLDEWGYLIDRDETWVYMPDDYRKWKKEECDRLLRSIKSAECRPGRGYEYDIWDEEYEDLDDYEEYEELEENVLNNPEMFRNPSPKKLSSDRLNFHGIVQETVDQKRGFMLGNYRYRSKSDSE